MSGKRAAAAVVLDGMYGSPLTNITVRDLQFDDSGAWQCNDYVSGQSSRVNPPACQQMKAKARGGHAVFFRIWRLCRPYLVYIPTTYFVFGVNKGLMHVSPPRKAKGVKRGVVRRVGGGTHSTA